MSACTPKQAGVLAKFGYDPDEYDFDRASAQIDAIAANGWKAPEKGGSPAKVGTAKKHGPATHAKPTTPSPTGGNPCTPKQAAVLDKFGYETEGVTFDEASDLIDAIAANGWKALDDDGPDEGLAWG